MKQGLLLTILSTFRAHKHLTQTNQAGLKSTQGSNQREWSLLAPLNLAAGIDLGKGGRFVTVPSPGTANLSTGWSQESNLGRH